MYGGQYQLNIKMKTYYETDKLIFTDVAAVPKDLTNQVYCEILEEIKNNLAVIQPHTLPTPTWNEIRSQRDALLRESDWISVSDSNPKPNKESWIEYRKTLRNIPQFFPSPQSVVWPIKPS